MILYAASLLVILNLHASIVSAGSSNNEDGTGLSLLKRLLQDINAERSLKSLDTQGIQKRDCRVGWNSDLCRSQELHDLMKSKAYLESGESPGKRSGDPSQNPEYDVVASQVSSVAIPEGVDDDDDVDRYPNLVDPKESEISLLKNILYNLNGDRSQQTPDLRTRKRTCRLRLGGHCNTEMLDKAAKSYYYLKSGHSPGKRRRRSLRSIVRLTN